MKPSAIPLALSLVAALSVSLAPAVLADTTTTVTTTTVAPPVMPMDYQVTRRSTTFYSAPIVEKRVTIERPVLIEKEKCTTYRTTSQRACVHHASTCHKTVSHLSHTNRVLAYHQTRRVIEKPVIVKRETIEKRVVVEKPVYVNRVIEKPVYVNRVIEKPVYVDRIVEKPVYQTRIIEQPVVVERRASIVPIGGTLVKEKIEHHNDHDTIKIQRYF